MQNNISARFDRFKVTHLVPTFSDGAFLAKTENQKQKGEKIT